MSDDPISSVPANDRYMAFGIYLVLNTLLIILNSLVFLTIKLSFAFIAIIVSSIYFRFRGLVANLREMRLGFIHIVLTLPITFTGRNIYANTPFYWFFRVAVASELINFMTSMVLVLSCAANAFFIFFSTKLHDKIFGGQSLNILLALTWIVPLFETLVETFTDCPKSFSYERLAFAYDCSDEQELQFQFHNFDSYQRLGYPGLALLFNILLYIYIQYVLWKSRKAHGSSKKGSSELFLVFQGLLICLFTGGNAIVFNFVAPLLLTGPIVPIMFPLLLNVATMCFYNLIVNRICIWIDFYLNNPSEISQSIGQDCIRGRAIAEPTLTILFNSSVRKAVRRLLTGKIGVDESRFVVEATRTQVTRSSIAAFANR